MKAICNCGLELIFDKEVDEWACINCGYMYDEYYLVKEDWREWIKNRQTNILTDLDLLM